MINKLRINKRKGSALVMVLVVLLIGSMLLLTSAYMVENLSTTTHATKQHANLYAAAQRGQEIGKAWIAENVANDGPPLGQSVSDSDPKAAKKLKGLDGNEVKAFFPDLVASADNIFGVYSEDIGQNIGLYVVIYDGVASLDITEGEFSTSDQPPPRIVKRGTSKGQSSARQGQSYFGANRGGTGESSGEPVPLPAYVIRSLARKEGRSFGIEGGYRLDQP